MSQEIPPLDISMLPERVKNKLNATEKEEIPKVTPEEVFRLFEKRKMKKSMTPGD